MSQIFLFSASIRGNIDFSGFSVESSIDLLISLKVNDLITFKEINKSTFQQINGALIFKQIRPCRKRPAALATCVPSRKVRIRDMRSMRVLPFRRWPDYRAINATGCLRDSIYWILTPPFPVTGYRMS